jgi:SH3-like domain-containing protein
MKHCSNCQKRIGKTVKHCPYCGKQQQHIVGGRATWGIVGIVLFLLIGGIVIPQWLGVFDASMSSNSRPTSSPSSIAAAESAEAQRSATAEVARQANQTATAEVLNNLVMRTATAAAREAAAEDATTTTLRETTHAIYVTETALAAAQATAHAQAENQAREGTAAALYRTEQAIEQTTAAFEATQAVQSREATQTAQVREVATAAAAEQTAVAMQELTFPSAVSSGSTIIMRANKDLNIRNAPGFDSQSLTVLEHGYDIELLGEKRTVDGVTWLRGRTLTDHITGWVSNRHIRTISDMCNAGYSRSVQSTRLHMRSTAGRTQPVVAELNEGEQVELLGSCTQVETSQWTRIRLSSGAVGWVNSRFLE